ncbi:hypothetical protein SEA_PAULODIABOLI_64 [Microbacterium phage PauloDiaboli]|nr:hypothetical protein SEA_PAULODIABOLI_64 [Microbacterium phage PauloDiaboli]QWY83915.1 hypothetical protein SEA_A3WALLY_65 [Microbacterium phage A3Wally]
MPYRVIKEDALIESADEVAVGEGGVLITYEDLSDGRFERKRISSLYSKGQWDVVYWDDPSS